MQKSALFIGRFQPLHLGHLDAIKQILKKEKHLIIGIGSAGNNFEEDNPFSASERYQMIDAALAEEGITRDRYAIIPVKNIDNYALWVKHVELLVPPFDKIYTGSSIVHMLFREHGKKNIQSIKMNLKINATDVREKMIAGKNWEKFVPSVTAKMIKKWNGPHRLKVYKTNK